jgi:hypothetical protein
MIAEFARTVSNAGVAAGATAIRPARIAVGAARSAERKARDRAADDIGRAAVAVVDRVLASSYTETALRHVLESALAERAIVHALDVVETTGLPEQIADRLLADGMAERLAGRLLEGPELDRIALLAFETASVRAEAALASAQFERLVGVTLESAAMERLVAQVLSSRVVESAVTRLIDDAVARMPDSEPVWQLIDVIAQSPAVTEAISQQGVGFADLVAEEVRDRTRTVDDRLEHGARRLFRRRIKGSGPGGAEPSAGPA